MDVVVIMRGMTEQLDASEATLAAVAMLADRVRRSLFDVVRRSSAAVTREEAAEAVGVSRNLAAFHLDKLVAAGLLEAAPSPHGSGRPGRRPRCYAPADTDVAISIPPRKPTLLAQLLLAAMVEAEEGASPVDTADRVARRRGRALGAAERAARRPGRLGAERALSLLMVVLGSHGYDPVRGEGVAAQFRSCPFHPMARDAPEIVCRLHHSYLTGLLEGLQAEAVEPVLAPGTGGCCVELRRR